MTEKDLAGAGSSAQSTGEPPQSEPAAAPRTLGERLFASGVSRRSFLGWAAKITAVMANGKFTATVKVRIVPPDGAILAKACRGKVTAVPFALRHTTSASQSTTDRDRSHDYLRRVRRSNP